MKNKRNSSRKWIGFNKENKNYLIKEKVKTLK